MHVLDQDGPDFLWEVTKYYASPEVFTKGSNTIGRPVSTSSYWCINSRRRETNIQSRTQYLNYLHQNEIKGVLVLESDPESERIMEIELSPVRVYLFRMTQNGFEHQWSIQRPAFDAPEGISLRKRARAIWSELGEVFRR